MTQRSYPKYGNSLKLFVFWYQSLRLFTGNIHRFNNTLLQAVHPSRPLLKKSLMAQSPGNLQTIVAYFPALWSDTQCPWWKPNSCQKPESLEKFPKPSPGNAWARVKAFGSVRGSSALPDARLYRFWLSGERRPGSAGKPLPAARRDHPAKRASPGGVLLVPRPAVAHLCSPALSGRRPARIQEECGGLPQRSPGPLRRPAGNSEASQTPSGSQNLNRAEGSATPSRTQSLGGVSASAGGAGACAREHASVRVRARMCGCVCVCVRARGCAGVCWGEERSSSPYLSKMSRTINMQKAKGKAR